MILDRNKWPKPSNFGMVGQREALEGRSQLKFICWMVTNGYGFHTKLGAADGKLRTIFDGSNSKCACLLGRLSELLLAVNPVPYTARFLLLLCSGWQQARV